MCIIFFIFFTDFVLLSECCILMTARLWFLVEKSSQRVTHISWSLCGDVGTCTLIICFNHFEFILVCGINWVFKNIFFSTNWFKFITLLMSFVSMAKIRPTLEFCPVSVSKLLRWTLMFFSYPWNFPCTVTPSTPGFMRLDVGAPDVMVTVAITTAVNAPRGDSVPGSEARPHIDGSIQSLQSQFVLTEEEDTEPQLCPCFLQNHRGSGWLSLSSHPGFCPNPRAWLWLR